MTAVMVASSPEVDEWMRGEYLGLVLFVGVGLMLMAEASHLLMAYVAIELVSLSSYVLVGFLNDRRSAEASLKYLLFGALASGIMLFGMSLLFGLTGELSFPGILEQSRKLSASMSGALLASVGLVLAGLAFKISMVPFHMWTPDAYEGAPIPVTALLSVGPKAAGVVLLLRVIAALEPHWAALAPLVLVLTAVTMTLGNVVALVQSNVKRLLAYSTIGQVGYLLIGCAVNTHWGTEAILFYLVAYGLMNLGVFACVVAVAADTGSEAVEAFRGLGRRAPALALLCTVCLLSLAGIPPLMGFLGKFLLFGSAVRAGLVWLAIVAIVNTAIALYYYVNIIRLMYLAETPRQVVPLHSPLQLKLAIGLCGVATLLLGLFPDAFLQWLSQHATAVNLL